MTESATLQIANFEKENKQGVFKHIKPKQVVDGLRERLADPYTMNQGRSSLCGPTSLLYSLLLDKPNDYTKYVLDLYRTGKGKIGDLDIEPGTDCKNYNLDTNKIAPVDWIAMASIRDSENDAFDYQSVENEFAGITMPGDLADWMEDAGYATVHEKTNVWFTKDKDSLKKASERYAAGYRVHLFIAANVLYEKTYKDSSWTPDHWVTLDSSVNFSGDDEVSFFVYTWGSRRRVPSTGTMKLEHFLDDYYGYVAARLVDAK